MSANAPALNSKPLPLSRKDEKLTARKPTTKAKPKTPRKSRAKPGAKIGRPSMYSESLVARICSELACGKSLRTVCKGEGMPSTDTIFQWIHRRPDFAERYARAKQESADALVEEMVDIADDGTNDFVDDGEGGIKFNSEHVQRSRLRIETRKWISAKLKPKKYGERLDMNHGIQPEDPLAKLISSIQGNSFEPVQKGDGEDDDDA